MPMTEPYSHAYYPAFLDLRGRRAVVVGGGSVAERKIAMLLEYGADVVCVAPTIMAALGALVEADRLKHEPRGYVRGDLEGAFIVVCATDSTEVNRAVFQEAESRGCLVNVVDVPELCNFIVPSIVKRGPLQIAISTGGAAPVVAKQIRRELEESYGADWESYVRLLGQVRRLVLERVPGGEPVRKPIFEAIAASDLYDRVMAGERPSADEVFNEFVAGHPGISTQPSAADSRAEHEA
ncbi:MAG: bifunctional precorrin-2 dehydrogenase/sirohydrochlorin ferrochelatase [Coriobacteriia bacterium]|jgi:precorrin-2 dehydrogenase/sirohydrochlorin ferrochelatase|nr:bifunctional precorrin-2 dehydrogenase/sirohydrochlorin ferrochelatase [Coriobacteriia bacterium]